jgi:hypothetical protein
MSREKIAHVQLESKLTEEEAATLRRVAFGQSDEWSLRQADLARLLEMRLIGTGCHGPELTQSGMAYFDTLATRPR